VTLQTLVLGRGYNPGSRCTARPLRGISFSTNAGCNNSRGYSPARNSAFRLPTGIPVPHNPKYRWCAPLIPLLTNTRPARSCRRLQRAPFAATPASSLSIPSCDPRVSSNGGGTKSGVGEGCGMEIATSRVLRRAIYGALLAGFPNLDAIYWLASNTKHRVPLRRAGDRRERAE